MKLKRLISPLLAFAILMPLLSGAADAAGFEEFSDVTGHWAEATLERGFDDGLIEGYEDKTLRPDSPITTAEMVSVLTRLLNADKTAAVSVDEGAWYYEAFSKAAYLGILPDGAEPDEPMKRQDAFAMVAKTFSLTPAAPDMAALDSFSDRYLLSAQNRSPAAALVSSRIILGFDGALNANGSINRAEFLTILYRISQNYIEAVSYSPILTGGTVIRGGGSLFDLKLSDCLWFDCSADEVSMYGVEAGTVTLRSHSLSGLTVAGDSRIDRLVIDCGQYSVDDSSFNGSEIHTLQLAGSGSAVVSGANVRNIEITGDNSKVTVGGEHESLIIGGRGNNVILAPDANIGSISLLGTECSLTTMAGYTAVAGGVEIKGSGNWLELALNGSCGIKLSGNYNSLLLTLSGGDLAVTGESNVMRVEGEASTAALVGQKNRLSVNGSIKSIDILGRETLVDGSGSAEICIVNAAKCKVSLSVGELTDNSYQIEKDRVLKLVTLGYKGNYTLDWAKNNDYEADDKEIWINARGYHSTTDHLIWVNLSMQRVNIFKGRSGEWELEHSCIVGTGKSGSGTPPGVYTTTYKYMAGWTTSSYTVRPVVGFKMNTGYAFHSRLYYPNTTTLKDPSVGFPISLGCVRMYDEDIWYVYNNIPLGTTVVVY